MEKLGIIYCYKNKVNGKCYIGQTVNESKRKRDHRCAANNGSVKGSVFHSAIRKYGYNFFEYTILHSGKTKEDLNVLEQIEIEKHNTLIPFGYNLKTGGKQRVKLSNESIAKMRKSMTEKHSNPEYSKKHKAIMKAVVNTKEYKEKRKGSIQNKKSAGFCIPIFCETNQKYYISATVASKELGLNQVLASRVIRGKNTSTRGYYFRKATEQESKEIKARYKIEH